MRQVGARRWILACTTLIRLVNGFTANWRRAARTPQSSECAYWQRATWRAPREDSLGSERAQDPLHTTGMEKWRLHTRQNPAASTRKSSAQGGISKRSLLEDHRRRIGPSDVQSLRNTRASPQFYRTSDHEGEQREFPITAAKRAFWKLAHWADVYSVLSAGGEGNSE
jgi:hypothetical protein